VILVIAAAGTVGTSARAGRQAVPPPASVNAQGYVGSATCQACHSDVAEFFAQTIHARLSTLPGWSAANTGCESCHGPGKAHVDSGGDPANIRTFVRESPTQISATCLTCHAGRDEHNNFIRGDHGRNNVGCVDCHAPHSAPSASQHMLTKTEPQLCLSCHAEMKARFSMSFHHRVLEGAMVCSDCHNPHGGFELKQVRLAVGADAPCVKCHADKLGPFAFEHAPLKIEGCAICHDPHGSNDPRLLKRNEVRQLCFECHSNVATIGAPNTPSFHNQANPTYQNCTLCHVKIHGSNSDPFFFR
jgi:DmsE family decaheme c-type cytochrome